MCLNQLFFAKESMWDTMNHLAKTEKAMFTEPSNSKQRSMNSLSLYSAKTLRQTEDLLQKTAFIKEKLVLFGWPIAEFTQTAKEYIEELDKAKPEGRKLFEETEVFINEKFKLINEYCENYDFLIEKRVDLLERRLGLMAMNYVVPEGFEAREGKTNKFHTITGLIPTGNLIKLQKLLFRVSRENVLIKSKTLDEVKESLFKEKKPTEQKTLVFILFPKTEKEVIVNKIKTVLKHYNFTHLETPGQKTKSLFLLRLNEELDDNRKILLKTQDELNFILEDFAKPKFLQHISYVNVLLLIVKREENFARNLAFIEEKDGFYQLLIWVPESFIDNLHQELNNIRLSDPTFTKPKIVELGKSATLRARDSAPTYFRLNSFTKPFQLIVDTYGVPKYKEANPGLFTIVSFPFLFGLMFGDMGHGLILTVIGLSLVLFVNNKVSILNDIKYLILLMGLFAFYCGFIYNEFFSVPFLSQDSCYVLGNQSEKGFKRRSPDCTYSVGMDWIWGQASNETSFINSFKMKFSIIVGVVQMLFGILLKGLNGLYFNNSADFWFEAVPQFIFLSVTFGYMSFCIIIKWLQNWQDRNPVSIIQLFINFVSVDEPLYLTKEIQQTIQIVFALVSFICIFLMLIPKPFILHNKHKQEKRRIKIDSEYNPLEDSNNLMGTEIESTFHEEEEEETLGELFVHQMIETIEFVLGSVSNTASYLRLWALSLAHGQLSKVFLNMIFGFTIQESTNPFISFFIIIFGFVFFFFVTAAVIMLMDSMECFLHALRLHWVEFQNKFYKGEGISFRAFRHTFEEGEKFD